MTIPDISGLTRQDLVALMQQINQALQALDEAEEQTKDELANPAAVREDIALMREWRENVQGVLDTPNADLKANPQLAILTLGRAQLRTMNATIRALQLASRVFVETPEPESADRR